MPGIVGLISKLPAEEAQGQLRRMVGALCHEAFYVTGTWMDASLGVYVGWVARKGSFSEAMPICNERGDLVLAFSGEDYAEPGVVRHLKAQGHEVPEKGPGYLVHLYEEDRAAFPGCLNGRFQGFLTDGTRGTAILFNDRFGMHRIYYHESTDAFYFAAEAKAILAVRPELRRADPRGLGELVSCGCVLENRTVFKGIQVLPAGSAWTFRARALNEKQTYFQPHEWETQSSLDPEPYYQELQAVFSQPAAILQWQRACRNVIDRRLGHQDDYGLAEASAWVASVLHIRGYDPRVPGCHRGSASSPCLWPIP